MAVLVALGLGSRRVGMPDFVVLYAGDVLWGAFFFTLGAFLWPSVTPLRLWSGAIVVTELICQREASGTTGGPGADCFWEEQSRGPA